MSKVKVLPRLFRVVDRENAVLLGPFEGWDGYYEAQERAVETTFRSDVPVSVECSPDDRRWKLCGRTALRELGHQPDFIEFPAYFDVDVQHFDPIGG